MRKLDRYSEYGASILLLLTALFALIAHWLACIWYAIGNAEHQYREPKIGWLNTLAQQTEQHYTDDPQSGPNLPTKYITALYFTFSSLTSIGFGNVSPNTNAEKVFSIIVMLVGSLMYASIFGNVGALIQRLYSGTARYHAQMLRIKEFIRFHQIPSPLRQRLEEYSTQVWEHTNGIDMTMVQYSFPESLQSDICLYVYRDFLGGSPAFKSLSDGCLRNISLRIRATHMPPSDTLIHTGDLLTSVYYVVKGSLEVVTTDDLILGVLNPGDFFGGLPTLVVQYTSTGSAHCPHDFPGDSCLHSSATQLPSIGSPPSIAAIATAPPPKSRFAVRALTYADVQFIDRHDLTDLCHVYPELSTRLLERFELTIPLVSGSNPNTQPPRSASAWFNCKSNLDAFLASSATWNPVAPDILRSLVPLVSRRSARADRTKECLNPNKPIWELERLQRLFDHGALCTTSTDDPPIPVTPKNPLQTNFHSTSVDPTRSTTGFNPSLTSNTVNTVCSSNNNSRAPASTKNPQQSPKERQLRRLFARSRSPASEVLTHPAPEVFTHPTSLPTSVENCFSVDESIAINPDVVFASDADPQTVRCLLARFARVEKQIQQLDARISTTIGQILTHLQNGVLTPPIDS
ncbi:hypothetical protein PHET_01908 [Paragonimus heterotremus]|uniref:Cyclic nucleotide-binding domain-containing protein n=1 Tax=Paragonimus heterotremus TaxID=100268 RepID=A0A8J4TDE3_9TREM|nr:hypothetical protein PHET_01908 [Paragonimus heterotremus]